MKQIQSKNLLKFLKFHTSQSKPKFAINFRLTSKINQLETATSELNLKHQESRKYLDYENGKLKQQCIALEDELAQSIGMTKHYQDQNEIVTK